MKFKFDVEKIHTLTLKPNEVLIVKLKQLESAQQALQIKEYLSNLLETKRIVVCDNNVDFLKLELEEHLIDEFIEKELTKK